MPEVWVGGNFALVVCGEGSWRYPGKKKTRRSAEKEKGRTVLLLRMLLQSHRVNKFYFFVAL